MTRTSCVAISVGLLAWLCPHSAYAQPKGVELRVEQQGPTPMPHQAIRLRLTLHNQSDHQLNNLQVLESAAFLTKAISPSAPKIQPYLGQGEWPSVKLRYHQPALQAAYGKMKYAEKMVLLSRQSVSVTSPFGFGVLQCPGEHELQFGYMQRYSKGFDLPAKPFMVKVQQPMEDDAVVCKALDDNPKLCSLYYSMVLYGYEVGCTRKEADFFQALLTKYPKSSYADYFRLLLANYNLKYHGTGELILTADDIAAGVALLEPINFKDFPFGPDVLLLLKKYSKDPAKVKKLEETLQANYWDAYEWLEDQAESGVAFEKIQEKRKAGAQPKPEPKKP